MVTKNEHFITRMELRELREQRNRLTYEYDQLKQNAEQARTPTERLRHLYYGLKSLKISHQSLHPDIANLEFLLDHSLPETTTFWCSHLEKELKQGQLRSEIVYTFGALLEEWAALGTNQGIDMTTQSRYCSTLITQACQPVESPPFNPILDRIFASFSFSAAEMHEQMQNILIECLQERVEEDELTGVLQQISQDFCCTAQIRGQARAFLMDDILLKEFADALTIMLNHIDEWNWPQEGLPVQAFQTMTKWRLFVDSDLPTACFLEVMGTRWQKAVQKLLWVEQNTRLKTISRQIPNGDFTDSDRQLAPLTLLGELDIWTERVLFQTESRWIAYTDVERRSIYSRRADLRQKLRSFAVLNGYGGNGEKGFTSMEHALAFINAEIQLARAALPHTPFYVVKVDLKDFYPDLSHELLFSILTRLGVSSDQLEFFQKFLRVPVQNEESTSYFQRGVPNSHRLSDMLGELVLSLLEQYILQKSRVRIIRLLDDICFLTPSAEEAVNAWKAIQEFCQGCGLELNQKKCGAVGIGAPTPSELPSALPGWMYLTLDKNAQWHVNNDALAEYLTYVRGQIAQTSPLLTKIELYNTCIKQLVRSLGLRVPLGNHHRDDVLRVIWRVHHEFFPEEGNMVDILRKGIHERFLHHEADLNIPEALFYWPITAGGTSLLHVVVLATMYTQEARARANIQIPEERKENWQTQLNEWSMFYGMFCSELDGQEPETNKIIETLIHDFIKRGSGLFAGRQHGLSAYWRWVLYIYGPQILDSLGSFRFLISDLVPLQLTNTHNRQVVIGENGLLDTP